MTASALGLGEALPADAVEVGRIVGPWGIKGGLRIVPHAADPQALLSSRRWFIQLADAAPVLLKITLARTQGDAVVATAQDVPDRNAAEALKGARVFVSRASFPTAGSDEYYWIDLIGLQVVNREGVLLGSVVDLLATGPHSVLRVRPMDAAADVPAEEAERLIPFVAAYVDDVDLGVRRITVDWGLDF
jgi:16S rRNA processing protein RimM